MTTKYKETIKSLNINPYITQSLSLSSSILPIYSLFEYKTKMYRITYIFIKNMGT